ncbi:MAG TPA: PAS domain-containing protein [Alphaproteobacteria bacterium]|jgi:hypothetical protein
MLGAPETTTERPVGLERRLVFRLLSHWRTLIVEGEGDFPSFADVDPSAMPDVWPFCFVLDTATDCADDPIVRIAQPSAAGLAGNVIGKPVSELPDATLIAQACSYAQEVLRKRVPISRGGDFIRRDGMRVLYRSILLPMSDDGENIAGLLGAANFREVKEP